MDYRVGWNGMGVYILAKMGKKCTEEIGNCYTEYGPGTKMLEFVFGEGGMGMFIWVKAFRMGK